METKTSAELLRKKLGSIDLKRLLELEKLYSKEVPQDRQEYRNGVIVSFYNEILKDQLDLFILAQSLEGVGTGGIDPEGVVHGRGTLNGFILLKEWFESHSLDTPEEEGPEEDELSVS